jgi:Protein of unknown function (DUF3662)/FHA domain
VGVLQRFEQKLDRLVNGAFARAFRSEVQPVEIAAALQRELDDKAAVLDRERTVAPNVLTVELGPGDYERLAPYSGPLGTELATMVQEHADTQGYQLMGPPEVSLVTVDDLPTGVFRVVSEGRAGVVAQPWVQQPSAVAEPAPLPSTIPHARLIVGGTSYPLTQTVTTIGRGTDVDIRIDDPGISRKHAEFRVATDGSGFSVIDLASTNGTYIGNQKVAERLLTDGDEVRMGATSLTFRVG